MPLHDKPRLMILGAGVYQVPLIEASLSRGCITYVVSPNEDDPGTPLAHQWIKADTRDGEKIYKYAKELKIDGIVTTGTDVATQSIGLVVDQLNLCGPNLESARKSSCKIQMKKAFQDHDVPTAKFAFIRNWEDLESKFSDFPLPFMIKGPNSSGSRGIKKVCKQEELKDAFIEAKTYSTSGSIILEEFLDGVEFGAQAVVIDHKIIDITFHNDQVTEGGTPTPIGHSVPIKLDHFDMERAKTSVRKAIEALEINNTIANVDLMQVGKEFFIIEIGARMGATCIPEILSLYYQINYYDLLIDISLGRGCHFSFEGTEQGVAALLLSSKESGTLKEISFPQKLQKHPNIKKIHFDKKKGDPIKAFRNGPDRIGEIIVTDKDPLLAQHCAQQIASELDLKLENSYEPN